MAFCSWEIFSSAVSVTFPVEATFVARSMIAAWSRWVRSGSELTSAMAASSSSSGATSLVDVLARTPTGRLVPAGRLLDVFELLVSGKMRGVAGSEITVDEGFTAGWRTARSVR